jgi:hypothetical protein
VMVPKTMESPCNKEADSPRQARGLVIASSKPQTSPFCQ